MTLCLHAPVPRLWCRGGPSPDLASLTVQALPVPPALPPEYSVRPTPPGAPNWRYSNFSWVSQLEFIRTVALQVWLC